MSTVATRAIPAHEAAPADRSLPRGLGLAHLWVAFGAFGLAVILGAYQVLERAGIAPHWAEGYYTSVTGHGVIMAYVLTTFFNVGYGYVTATSTLNRPIWARGLAWLGFAVMTTGVVLAVYAILTRQGTVLYTFYPPLTAHWSFYVGAAMLIIGSWAWILIMVVMAVQWKRDNPGGVLPLAMFAMTVNALLWFWTTLGVGAEVLFQIIPLSLGWIETIDVGLARTLFAWTLHPIVYFWLIPAYVAAYVYVPKAAGGRLFSDEMARVSFIMLWIFSLPIGFHHIYMDPQQADGWKLFHAFGTFGVALPTLITAFTVMASLEIGARLRGGKGLIHWVFKLPWDHPMVVAGVLAGVMLMLGGFGGLVNASFAMNAMVHNTMWVPAHFHLIFAGTSIIMYFAIAYWIWPALTGRRLHSNTLALTQIWLWFIGMTIMTTPWHWVGLEGMPRRTAWIPAGNALEAGWMPYQYVMAFGGVLLTLSGLLFVYNLIMAHRGPVAERPQRIEYAEPVHPVLRVPKTLNGFAFWNWLLLVWMILAFGYPILQFFFMDGQHQALPWGW